MPRSLAAFLAFGLMVGCGKKKDEEPSGEPTSGSTSKAPTSNPVPKSDSKVSKKPESSPAVEFGQWCQVGDVRIKITGAKVGKAKLTRDAFTGGEVEYEGGETYLMVNIAVENLSKTKKLEYRRPTGTNGIYWVDKMTDEHGNEYRHGPYELGKVNGRPSSATLYPEAKGIEDVLCYQVPVSAATELHLLLKPAWAATGDSPYHFKIPASAWKN